MAVDYKALNRQQDFTVPQKAAIKKIFVAAEVAAPNPGVVTGISRTAVHTIMAGDFDGDARHDIQALMKEIRSAIAADDSSRNIDSVVGSFRMGGNRRRVLRKMANAVIAQIT